MTAKKISIIGVVYNAPKYSKIRFDSIAKIKIFEYITIAAGKIPKFFTNLSLFFQSQKQTKQLLFANRNPGLASIFLSANLGKRHGHHTNLKGFKRWL